MRAAIYYGFGEAIKIEDVQDPVPASTGVVIRVGATGICRSDWWGWQGNDSDIKLPHVPGHELAGTIVETGKSITKWKAGDRVTVPFVGGCGRCAYCLDGQHQVCDHQFQPGFTAWGSFAEYVMIDYADENLLRLPDAMTFVEAASLGCRFITAFRALVHQTRLQAGEWLAVHACGGVGLSAIMIGKALDAKIIAVDIDPEKLKFAQKLGADVCILSTSGRDVVSEIIEFTEGGAHVSMDALGSPELCRQSIMCLRKQGRHVQVGLMESTRLPVTQADNMERQDGQATPNVLMPINRITGFELTLYGSHGMQAAKYHEIFSLIKQGKLDPGRLVTKIVDLETGVEILMSMDRRPPLGIAVINPFANQ